MKDWVHSFDDRFWLLADEMPPEQARFIRRALRLRKGQRVLDVPCGAGRTSLALAKLGIEVTGLDMRSKFTNRAKRRFRKEGLAGTFLVGDMRELDFDGEFHAVVNWFGSFGYFSGAENLDVLRRFARAVRPGGRVLIHQINRRWLFRNFRREIRSTLRDRGRRGSGVLVSRNRWNAKLERIESTWTLDADGKQTKCSLSMRLYTLGQFKALFHRTGLEFEDVHGLPPLAGTKAGLPHGIVVVGRKRRERRAGQ